MKRSDAWYEIANILNVEKNEVEKKIKNLITQFRRELKKTREQKSGSSASDNYHSQWFAFNSMLFLADKHTPHKTYDAGLQVR